MYLLGASQLLLPETLRMQKSLLRQSQHRQILAQTAIGSAAQHGLLRKYIPDGNTIDFYFILFYFQFPINTINAKRYSKFSLKALGWSKLNLE